MPLEPVEFCWTHWEWLDNDMHEKTTLCDIDLISRSTASVSMLRKINDVPIRDELL